MKTSLKQKISYTLAVTISIFLLFIFITSIWIGHEVKSLCQNAQWQYGGGCHQALAHQLDDNHQSYRHRNHAVWAMAQLGNTESLPILKKYYTGNIPSREPLDQIISQYELKKAISLIDGGVNLSGLIWKNIYRF